MAATAYDDILNAALTELCTGTRIDVCATEPTTYAEATSTYTLGNYTITAGDGGGDWTIADDGATGRKATLAAQSGNTATGTGAGNYIAVTDGAALLAVFDGDGDTVTSGQEWTTGAADVLNLPNALT